jgi:hypothetical protein
VIRVAPTTVKPGGAVRVIAARSPCRNGDTVFAISTAFPGNAFGNAGALTGPVGAAGSFSVAGHVRSGLRPGRYEIGARCGGGNLGVSVSLLVVQ